jgi:hypothetical protein
MKSPYIEENCIFEFEGKSFEAGGAYLTPDYAIGYMSSDMKEVRTWHGEFMGYAKITSFWRLPLTAWISDKMYQVQATINGIKYTGRTCGGCMIVRLRRMKRQ